MTEDISKIEREALAAVRAADSLNALKGARVKYLGRADGALTLVLRGLSGRPLEERKTAGPQAHAAREKIETALRERELALLATAGQAFDATLPPAFPCVGHLHPLTQMKWQLEDLFTRMGFIIEDGPEVESEWYNFDALNMPSWHPARDMQDTFYVEAEGRGSSREPLSRKDAENMRLVLRTQTSPVQIRAMEKYGAPLRCIVPGQVYRNEATDARHENTFWQIEGLMIDRDISLAHLNAVSRIFLKELFGNKVEMRVRPGYFPFTEPSVEMDITCQICQGRGVIPTPTFGHPSVGGESPLESGVPTKEGRGVLPLVRGDGVGLKRCPVCKGTGWLEFMGAGLVHPVVLKNGGVDPKKYSGFAFGFGLTRLAMMKYGIEDVRLLMSGDMRFLEQF